MQHNLAMSPVVKRFKSNKKSYARMQKYLATIKIKKLLFIVFSGKKFDWVRDSFANLSFFDLTENVAEELESISSDLTLIMKLQSFPQDSFGIFNQK